jgi:KDO2-lipid IV(A) lauroyltransferase
MIRRAIVWAVAILQALASVLPWRLGVALGGWVGWIAFAALPAARRRALAHVAIAFPDGTGDAGQRAMARRSFVNLGRSAFEVLMLSRRSHPPIERLCAIEGEERLKAALAAGRGVIFLTGHFGNWELMAALVTRRGYPSSVVATPVYDPRLDRLLVDARARHGVHTISRGSPSAARHLLSGLRRNAILGMLIDQDTDVDGVFVPFFGRPACTRDGPARLAMRTGAPVFPVFIERIGSSARHRVRVQPPLELVPEGSDPEAAVLENVTRMSAVVEAAIRRNPDQWIWTHRRWKTRERDGLK